MIAQYSLALGSVSLPGRRRGANQDFATHFIPSDSYMLTTKGALFAVADGLGGHNAGQVASQLATQTLINAYYRAPYNDLPWSLERAVQAANYAVWDQAMRVPAYSGMGTTLTALIVRGGRVFIANVGDSRVYLARGSRLWQITRDHSYVADLVALGSLSPAQARRHPWRKMLSRALGRASTVRVDLFQGIVVPGDVFFLCTDGLSDFVGDRQILGVLASARAPTDSAQMLATLAYHQGSDDNITGLVVRLAPARPAVVPALATYTTVPLPRGAMRAYRGGAVAAAVEPDRLSLVTFALGWGLVAWATYVAMLIASRMAR